MITIIMRQLSKNRWQIESETGKVLVEEILLPNRFYAEEYVKAYASTWGWQYRLEEV